MSNPFELYPFSIGEILEMKKTHPCGSQQFKVLQVGGEIKLCCQNCQRIVVLPRRKVEKTVRKVIKE